MKEKKKENLWKEKAKEKRMSAMDVFCSIFDNIVDAAGTLGSYKPYRVSANEYFRMKNCGHSDIRQQLYYLKKKKLIKNIIKNDENYLEITKEGFKKLTWDNISVIDRNNKWDKNFRLVMFDVPEDKKNTRDVIRDKLKEIGFIQIQKSVFIYPFECKQQIDALCYWCGAKRYIKYMVVKITGGEEEIIEEFVSKNILSLEDLS